MLYEVNTLAVLRTEHFIPLLKIEHLGKHVLQIGNLLVYQAFFSLREL